MMKETILRNTIEALNRMLPRLENFRDNLEAQLPREPLSAEELARRKPFMDALQDVNPYVKLFEARTFSEAK